MKKVIGLSCLVSCMLFADKSSVDCSEEGEARQKAIVQWEEAMNWVVPFSSRTFSLVVGSRPKIFQEASVTLEQFVALHGYFSCHKPLVGLVTEDLLDVDPLQQVFTALFQEKNPNWIKLATEELLTKALAYRNLQKGMKITFPAIVNREMELVTYTVDEVLDLWQGMPAFALLPEKKGAHPILLFRGTDFSFVSKSSWASILSDFDLSGAGLTTFRLSQQKIKTWLEKAAEGGKKAKVMGFSLGGILAVYTTVFLPEWIDHCSAFNAPGVSKAVHKAWKELPTPPPIFLYATQGDLISRFGKMVGSAFEISDKAPMGPIEAHTKIMMAKSPVLFYRIDLEKENLSRFRGD